MLFNSLSFVIFFPSVYLLYMVLPHRWQNRMLLLASYVFYGSWDWRFLSLIVTSTLVDYYCGLRIARSSALSTRKLFVLVSATVNLGLLATFKYFNFFADSFQALLSLFGVSVDTVTLTLILPVGISFYTFQTLSYSVDVYRGNVEPENDLADFALFVSFFPQLVAGPIERAARLLPQIRNRRSISSNDVLIGFWMVFWGYYLKVFVADNLAPIADKAFSSDGAVAGLDILVGVYAFAFQIFGDFAGYSSIAIGVARLMGFRLSTNFLCPYFVTNPRDFWKNWHISLSSWLRDYLYIPLGGNRGGRWFVYRNLLLTMLLGGLWHGAAWTFVVWGLFHGVLLIIHRRITEGRKARSNQNSKALGMVWTFVKVVWMFQITCVGWLLFRAESLGQVVGMIVSLADWPHPDFSSVNLALNLIFYVWLVIILQLVHWRRGGYTPFDTLPNAVRVLILVLMFYSITMWGNFGGGEFIYFQF